MRNIEINVEFCYNKQQIINNLRGGIWLQVIRNYLSF